MLETTIPAGSSLSGSPEPEVLPSTKALVCFLAPREFYRSTIVSTSEVFVGPDCRTERDASRIRALATSSGSYDLREVAAQLPAAQQPELILVKADATGRNQPHHLDA